MIGKCFNYKTDFVGYECENLASGIISVGNYVVEIDFFFF